MKTPILALAGPTGAPTNNTSTRYQGMGCGMYNGSWGTSANHPRISCSGTISDLWVRWPNGTTTGSWVVTLQINGADQSLSVTIDSSLGSPYKISDTRSVAVTAGQQVGWKIVPTSTPDLPSAPVQISCLFTGTTAGESVLFAAHTGSNTGGFYVQLAASNDSLGTEVQRQIIAPTDGVISKMYIQLTSAPGGAATRTYTLRVNGADSALTETMTGATAANTPTTNAVSVSKGDLIDISVAVSGGPTSASAGIGLNWLPTTDGESLAVGSFVSATSSGANRVGNLNGQTLGGITADSDVYNIAPFAFTAKKLRAETTTAPGGATYRDYFLRNAGASTAVTCRVSGAATKSTDDASEAAVAAGDLINVMTTPNGTPAGTSTSRASMVMYISPGGTRQMTLLGVG